METGISMTGGLLVVNIKICKIERKNSAVAIVRFNKLNDIIFQASQKS